MGNKHKKCKDKQKRIAVVPIIDRKCKRKRKLRIGMVTSRCEQRWIVPTGKLEKKLSERQVASLEAFEEAGLLGKLDSKFRIQVVLPSPCNQHQRKTTVFLMRVKRILKTWPEFHERRRKEVSVKHYLQTIRSGKLKRRLGKAGLVATK